MSLLFLLNGVKSRKKIGQLEKWFYDNHNKISEDEKDELQLKRKEADVLLERFDRNDRNWSVIERLLTGRPEECRMYLDELKEIYKDLDSSDEEAIQLYSNFYS